MKAYAKVLDETTGLVQKGEGCTPDYYKSIGMSLMEIDKSDIDFQWYLYNKCPKKSEEQKFQEAKEAKYYENSYKVNEKLLQGHFIITVEDKSASYWYDDKTLNNLNSSAIGFISGVITQKQWTDEEGNTVMLSQDNVAEMLLTLESWANPIWDKWGLFKKKIDNAQTIEEVNIIDINYD